MLNNSGLQWVLVDAAHHDVVDAGARGFAGFLRPDGSKRAELERSGHSISPNFWQRYEKGR